MSWFTATLRSYPEIALFLSLGIGYWVGGKSYRGFSLGAVTATLLAAIAIGQLGITVSSNVKSVFFLMFLFAVGYGVGPQFVRGIAKDGLPQAIFSVIQCVLCLAAPFVAAKLAGYSVGSAAGLFAGVADHLGIDGSRDRCDQSSRPARRRGQATTRCDADRLRGDLYIRHDRLGPDPGDARPEIARHRSRRGLQGIRGEIRRRTGARRIEPGLGTSTNSVRTGSRTTGPWSA